MLQGVALGSELCLQGPQINITEQTTYKKLCLLGDNTVPNALGSSGLCFLKNRVKQLYFDNGLMLVSVFSFPSNQKKFKKDFWFYNKRHKAKIVSVFNTGFALNYDALPYPNNCATIQALQMQAWCSLPSFLLFSLIEPT